MENDKKKAIIFISGLGILFLICLGLIFVLDKWYFKLIFGILAIIPAVILIRFFIAYKRNKNIFSGKVIAINKPSGKIVKKWTVIMKNGKISKKLYSLEEPKMKVGGTYGVAYEEKSNLILQVEQVQYQMVKNMMKGMNLNSNPKFK